MASKAQSIPKVDDWKPNQEDVFFTNETDSLVTVCHKPLTIS